jgi:hypothetical protein
MPYRTFASSEVLTASNVNTYLMQQAIIICTSGTRPSSPVSGMRIWQTDTLTEYAWNGSAWQFLRGVQQFVQKTANESVTSSTTLQNDDHLFLSVAANSVYQVLCFWITNAPSNADITFSFDGPSGFDCSFSMVHAPANSQTNKDDSIVNVEHQTSSNLPSFAGYGSDSLTIAVDMIVVTGANAGTFQLIWSQLTSQASPSTIKSGSFMHAEKVA